MEVHGRGLKKQANRDLIVERARGYRGTLTALRSEFEAALAHHQREVLFCRTVKRPGERDDGDFDDEEGGSRHWCGAQAERVSCRY